MKKSRLATGQRIAPSWVEDRMADRPPWRCHTEPHREWFTEFVIADLELRIMQLGAEGAPYFIR